MQKYVSWKTMLWIGIPISLFLTFVLAQRPTPGISEVFAQDRVDIRLGLKIAKERGVSPYDLGIDLLDTGNGKLAIRWFHAMTMETNEYRYVYGAAWSKWKTGDGSGALKDALYLSRQEIEPILQARTFYLLGSICLESRLLSQAKEHLRQGLHVYESLDKHGGRYLCLTLLAAVAIHERDFSQVDSILEEAFEANELNKKAGYRSSGLGRYYDLIGEKFFWEGNYKAALEAELKARDEFRDHGQSNAEYGVMVKIGILNLILGDAEGAHLIAIDVWNKYQTATASRILAHNDVILAKLSQCGQDEEDFRAREKSMRNWADKNPGGSDLLEILDYVLESVPCPEIKE